MRSSFWGKNKTTEGTKFESLTTKQGFYKLRS